MAANHKPTYQVQLTFTDFDRPERSRTCIHPKRFKTWRGAEAAAANYSHICKPGDRVISEISATVLEVCHG